MSQASSVALAVVDPDNHAATRADSSANTSTNTSAILSLKGTTRGLEIHIAAAPTATALGARLTELLAEAPSFFAGSDARVAFDGALPAGALACLEEVAARFELKLVEIGPVAPRPRSYAAVVRRADARRSKLADGTGPIAGTPVSPAAEAAAPEAAVPEAAVPEAAVPEAAVPEAAPAELALANTARYTAVIIQAVAEGDVVGAAEVAAPAAEVAWFEASERAEPSVDAPVRLLAPAEAAAIEAELASAVAIEPSMLELLASAFAPSASESPAAWSSSALATPAGHAAAIEAAVAHAAEAVATMTVDAPAELAEVASSARALAETMAGEMAIALAEEFAARRARDLAIGMAEELATQRAGELAAKMAEALAATRATELAEQLATARLAALPPGPRLVIGPVRSGVIVDHTGHVIIIGDVNPGAEVRAEGSIIVLGRLRGVAHAAIGRDAGCIVALTLQPQQLRIGRMVARAGAGDRPSDGAEIAYATGETIVVERFTGRLPSGLAASM